MRTHRLHAIALAIGLGITVTGASTLHAKTANDIDENYTTAGIEKPARVLVDKWGVSHIYANTFYDAFYVQGFMAARDRLWQIDTWRKRGLGEMAKDFGPAYVEGDRMARAVLFRGDMYREWLAYGSDAKRVAEAFVAGVNAYIDQTEKDTSLLSEEFQMLGYKPSKWKAEDIVRIRHHGLTLNAKNEIDRAEVFCKVKNDPVRVDWLRRETVPNTDPTLADGLDPCDVPFTELKNAYDLATATPKFSKKTIKATTSKKSDIALLYNVIDFNSDTARGFGSNNWVIAGERTTTGRPILANDPHRSHGAPSLRYISHLNAPGLSVIGAGEPFLPGISIGHNGTIGFGLTRFYMDQEDVYGYELNPDNKSEYKYKGRWEPFEVITEEIEVKGESEPRKEDIVFSRHGPLLYKKDDSNQAWALRAAWLDFGMAPYFGSMDYMRAQNWDQFSAAMNRWGAPGENQVFADKSGDIAWMPGGLTVIRPNWDGLTPVPGDGRYEWAGYRNMDELPSEHNPARGYIVTANENNIPPDHPAYSKGIGYEWSNDSRAKRLKALISKNNSSSLDDSKAWQLDTTSLPAVRLVALLDNVPEPTDDETRQAVNLLKKWNGNETVESPEAALFEVWLSKHLRTALVRAALDPEAAKLVGQGDVERVIQVLEKPEGWLSTQARDTVLTESLKQAFSQTKEKLGPDPKNWQWGKLHRAVFTHPLSPILDKAGKERFNVGDWPLAGSAFTPLAASYNDNFQLQSGASYRMILDVGNWDASQVTNTPGQSGNVNSKHYKDLAPLWASGQYFPLLYSESAVQANTETTITLTPD
ncbi:penicillin acylase family protein [Pollutimonas bauzanensis]|uniref:penicillin acylase family protein n=1 Tax=Pollutimonas bauzanensis TaxID=658167 RepID=UPI0033424E50